MNIHTLEAAIDADLTTNQKAEGLEPDRALLTVQDALTLAGVIHTKYSLNTEYVHNIEFNDLDEAKAVAHRLAKRHIHGYIMGYVQVWNETTFWFTKHAKVIWTF